MSSLTGERLASLSIHEGRIQGDRSHLVVDLKSGETAAPEKVARWKAALMLQAVTGANGQIEVTLPGMWSFIVDDPQLDQALSDHFGFHCGIRARGQVIFTTDGKRFASPRYEASALHILSSSTLFSLSKALPEAGIDVRRFRPNVIVETDDAEDSWVGKRFIAGAFQGAVTERTKRCGMTMIEQPGLPEYPDILRTIVKTRQRYLGVYADAVSGGVISVGDNVSVG